MIYFGQISKDFLSCMTLVMTMDGKSAATVNGGMVSISTNDGVHLNGLSKVITTDIECTNGVIHVFDAVLLPPAA